MKQSDDKFEVTLDVPQYKPEELKVTVINNILSIEGAHNEAKKGKYVLTWLRLWSIILG